MELAIRLLAGRTGMRVTEGLRERLAACLDGAARAAGRTPEAYAAGLAGDPDAFQALVDCVTVQESGFFRHPEQFAALGREVLPALRDRVVVWSAGCGNGQEAYSLAMQLAASGRPDWEVLATDVSAAAVARADLTTHLPAPPGRCQVVFCRNVLIYLTREAAGSFLGYSEAVVPPTARLTVERVGPAHALRVIPEGAGPGGVGEPASAGAELAAGAVAVGPGGPAGGGGGIPPGGARSEREGPTGGNPAVTAGDEVDP